MTTYSFFLLYTPSLPLPLLIAVLRYFLSYKEMHRAWIILHNFFNSLLFLTIDEASFSYERRRNNCLPQANYLAGMFVILAFT